MATLFCSLEKNDDHHGDEVSMIIPKTQELLNRLKTSQQTPALYHKELQIHQTLLPDLRTWKGKRPTEIFKSLQAAMKRIPSHEAVIVQEYLNARVEVKNDGRQRTLGKECIGSRQAPQAVWLLWRKLPWNARNIFLNWRSIEWHWSHRMANKDSSRPYYH